MVLIKFMLINLLVCSDVIIIQGFLKYCSTTVNPKYVENAKHQIVLGFVLNVIASHVLLFIHLVGGIDLGSYTKFEWVLLAISLISFILYVLSIFGIRINNRRFVETHRSIKIDNILLIAAIIAVILSMVSFQTFLGFVSM